MSQKRTTTNFYLTNLTDHSSRAMLFPYLFEIFLVLYTPIFSVFSHCSSWYISIHDVRRILYPISLSDVTLFRFHLFQSFDLTVLYSIFIE